MANHYEHTTEPIEPPDAKIQRLVKKNEAAFFLSVTPRTVENMVRDGRIPAIRIGRTIRFRLADILDHLKNQ